MRLTKLLRNRILQKASTRWLLFLCIGTWLGVIIFSSFVIRPTDVAVVARYSTISDIIQLDRWYWHFMPMVFLTICLLLNTGLSSRLLGAGESIELERTAVKLLVFQLSITMLSLVVIYHMTRVL